MGTRETSGCSKENCYGGWNNSINSPQSTNSASPYTTLLSTVRTTDKWKPRIGDKKKCKHWPNSKSFPFSTLTMSEFRDDQLNPMCVIQSPLSKVNKI